mmetsp:Transcript_78380/g.187912  ORF Transcript_78380/g.187912 Transcript_78380/m.187912 type:complete len:205 (+) Transcript_78380:1080-1694(+)
MGRRWHRLQSFFGPRLRRDQRQRKQRQHVHVPEGHPVLNRRRGQFRERGLRKRQAADHAVQRGPLHLRAGLRSRCHGHQAAGLREPRYLLPHPRRRRLGEHHVEVLPVLCRRSGDLHALFHQVPGLRHAHGALARLPARLRPHRPGARAAGGDLLRPQRDGKPICFEVAVLLAGFPVQDLRHDQAVPAAGHQRLPPREAAARVQ